MYLIVVCTTIIPYPGCAAVGNNIMMKLKIVSRLFRCPYSAVICFIHQTITHGIVMARSVLGIPEYNRILTVVKNTMVQHQSMTVGNHGYTNRQNINITGKQALCYNKII